MDGWIPTGGWLLPPRLVLGSEQDILCGDVQAHAGEHDGNIARFTATETHEKRYSIPCLHPDRGKSSTWQCVHGPEVNLFPKAGSVNIYLSWFDIIGLHVRVGYSTESEVPKSSRSSTFASRRQAQRVGDATRENNKWHQVSLLTLTDSHSWNKVAPSTIFRTRPKTRQTTEQSQVDHVAKK